MALTSQQILTGLNLPDFGRDNMRSLIAYATEHNITVLTNKDLSELIDHCFDIEVVDNIPEYYTADFDKASRIAEKILDICRRKHIGITALGDPDFPHQLMSVKCGGKETAPVLLYYKGDIAKVNDRHGIAIIGTRKATPEGVKDGEFFGHFAAYHGLNVVSGLALGSDSAAHRGALAAHGFTTAILAYGLAVESRDNAALQLSIERGGGLILTEYEPLTASSYRTLVERNRLQAGLSQSVMLIQSNVKKGGSMHAINTAIEQGKNVFAVDYRNTPLSSEHYTQCNAMLITQGKATAVTRENAHILLPKS